MNALTIAARRARIIAMLFAGICLISSASAQLAPRSINGRYLLIFDTSSAMKKRLPATQYAVERLFFSMMNGQLHPGDSIGVWTFDRNLRAGQFPLVDWLPQNDAAIAAGITNFIARQRYSRSTRFDAIMPDVNKLVQSSKRLTVLIFCDGAGEMQGTPFDQGINNIFKQNERALKGADQTYIIVLRSQFGQYTGYTVNSSATGVNFPGFPPLPAPPKPATPPETNPLPAKNEPNPPPVIHLPPLVIVGTNVGTNLIPAIPPPTTSSNPPPVKSTSNPPPVKMESNAPPALELLTNETNVASSQAAAAPTNASGEEETPSGLSRNGALAIGASLLAAAVALIVLVLIRSRKTDRGSLISRAMKKK